MSQRQLPNGLPSNLYTLQAQYTPTYVPEEAAAASAELQSSHSPRGSALPPLSPQADLLPALPISSIHKERTTALAPPRVPPQFPSSFRPMSELIAPGSRHFGMALNPHAVPSSKSQHRAPEFFSGGLVPPIPDSSNAIHSQTPQIIVSPLLASSSIDPSYQIAPPWHPSRPTHGETDEDFMRNVQRIVNDGDSASAGEERTPSPFVPSEAPGPSSPSPPTSLPLLGPRHAHSPALPSRLGAVNSTPSHNNSGDSEGEFDEPISNGMQGANGTTWTGLASRMTRSRDAKEAEQAIAAVRALEAEAQFRHLDKGKGKARETLSDDDPMQRSHATPSSSRSRSKSRHASPLSPPATPPRTKSKDASNLPPGISIAVSPVKGRRIQLIRPGHSDPTAPSALISSSHGNDTVMLQAENISEPVMRWLNTPSPKKPPKSRTSAMHRTRSQIERDWTSIDLGALAITVPTSSQRRTTDPTELLRMFDKEREAKKRKRLDAFRDDSSGSSTDEDVAASSSLGGASTSGSRVSASSTSRFRLPLRTRSPHQQSPLKPAHVEGLGRMAVHPGDLRGASVVNMADVENRSKLHQTLFGMDVHEDSIATSGSRSSLNGLWANNDSPVRLANASSAGSVPWMAEASEVKEVLQSTVTRHGPQWPDSQLPWSANEDARRTRRKRTKLERRELVERFLDRDSDSDSGHGSPTAESSQTSQVEDGVVAGARGLWALAQDKSSRSPDESPMAKRLVELFPSEAGPSGLPPTVFGTFPSPLAPPDPGDAKVALASRRDVRKTLFLATCRRGEPTVEMEEDEDEGEVRCVCRGPDDGKAMVRCDHCKTWSHQTCVGIQDENDLGDRWYCSNCTPQSADYSGVEAAAASSPVLVQPAEAQESRQSLAANRRALLGSPNKVAFASPPVSPTVSLAHSSPVRGHPRTPKVRNARRAADASGLPQTPRAWRFDDPSFRTPRFLDDSMNDVGDTPLDPFGTPSRGTKYSVAFMPSATPLVTRTSSLLRDGIFATPKAPSQHRFTGASATATIVGQHGVGSSASTLHDHAFTSPPSHHYSMSIQYTDTPVQRAKPVMNGLGPAVSLDSPSSRKSRKGEKRSS